MSAGLAGPSLSSHASSSASECVLLEHAARTAGRSDADARSRLTGKRRTGMPLTCLDAGRPSSFRHVT